MRCLLNSELNFEKKVGFVPEQIIFQYDVNYPSIVMFGDLSVNMKAYIFLRKHMHCMHAIIIIVFW